MPDKSLLTTPAPLSSKLVQNSEFFSSLPEKLAQEITHHLRAERWDKKSYIDHVLLQARFYMLLEGRIEVLQSNPGTGRSITLDLLQPGDGFDAITLLDNMPRNVFYSPLDELKVLSAPIDKMRHWIWTYPELNEKFMPYLAKKMRAQEDKTIDIALYDTVTRLSRIILKNINSAESYDGLQENAHAHYLVSGLSDEILARMAGSVRQVINQHMQHWKRQGVIEKKRNKIVIKDLQSIIDEADLIINH